MLDHNIEGQGATSRVYRLVGGTSAPQNVRELTVCDTLLSFFR